MLRSVTPTTGARSATQGAPASADALDHAAQLRRSVRKAVRIFVQAVIFAALATLFFFRVPQVQGRSMQPNVESDSHVLINSLAYGVALGPWVLINNPISRGDIVAFERGQGDDRKIFLKRVIALPGETVQISNGAVVIEGAPLQESYKPVLDHSNMKVLSVPIGTVFVLGDNRAESDDSRSFGPVAQSSIIGKALLVIWPLEHVKRIR